MLHCRFVTMLKMVVDNKVANVVLDFVDIKVAHMIESVKVAKFIDDELRSGRLIFCGICWNFEFLMYLLILISYFIWLAALLCCFELLVCWWRNRWVELYWYKFFLCGIEVFNCFEVLFFAEAFIWCFFFFNLASSRRVLFNLFFRYSVFYRSAA